MSQQVEFDGCADVLDRLDAFLDGDLDRAEAIAVEAHLAGCSACQAEHRLAEEVLIELRALPEFEVPAPVLEAVSSETGAGGWEKFSAIVGSAVRRPLPAAAAVAAVVVAVVLVSPWGGRQSSQYSEEEIRRATEETKLALAYVGDITRRAELRVKEKVLDQGVAAKTVRDVSRTFQIIGGMGAGAANPPATPQPTVKGS